MSFAAGLRKALDLRQGDVVSELRQGESLEHILDRITDIRISEAHHGPDVDRHYEYSPDYILRGLTALHLEFTPRAS